MDFFQEARVFLANGLALMQSGSVPKVDELWRSFENAELTV